MSYPPSEWLHHPESDANMNTHTPNQETKQGIKFTPSNYVNVRFGDFIAGENETGGNWMVPQGVFDPTKSYMCDLDTNDHTNTGFVTDPYQYRIKKCQQRIATPVYTSSSPIWFGQATDWTTTITGAISTTYTEGDTLPNNLDKPQHVRYGINNPEHTDWWYYSDKILTKGMTPIKCDATSFPGQFVDAKGFTDQDIQYDGRNGFADIKKSCQIKEINVPILPAPSWTAAPGHDIATDPNWNNLTNDSGIVITTIGDNVPLIFTIPTSNKLFHIRYGNVGSWYYSTHLYEPTKEYNVTELRKEAGYQDPFPGYSKIIQSLSYTVSFAQEKQPSTYLVGSATWQDILGTDNKTTVTEGGTFQITADNNLYYYIRYGIPSIDAWHYSNKIYKPTIDYKCSASEFGLSDDLTGIVTTCQCIQITSGITEKDPTWLTPEVKAGVWHEGAIDKFGATTPSQFMVNGTSYVRYGVDPFWHYPKQSYANGSYYCNATEFGIDPFPGSDKHCQYLEIDIAFPTRTPESTLSPEEIIANRAREFATAISKMSVTDKQFKEEFWKGANEQLKKDKATTSTLAAKQQAVKDIAIRQSQYDQIIQAIRDAVGGQFIKNYNEMNEASDKLLINAVSELKSNISTAQDNLLEQEQQKYKNISDKNNLLFGEKQKRNNEQTKDSRLSEQDLGFTETLHVYNYYLFVLYYVLIIIFSIILFLTPGAVSDSILRWNNYTKLALVLFLFTYPYSIPVIEKYIYTTYQYIGVLMQ